MANIQNQIDEISTAFYGSQVRGAIVEGLQSINDEVNSLNTNITEVDSKTEKMDDIVNTSTEKIQELIGEYNNINTEAQEKFKQIDGALSNVLVNSQFTNPTINGGDINNSKLSNVSLVNNVNMNGSLLIGTQGSVDYENGNSEIILNSGVWGNEYKFINQITQNPLYTCIPVKSGLDTIEVEANITTANPIEIKATSALNFVSSEEQAYNLSFGYAPNSNTFGLFNENTWQELMSLNANTLNELNINILPNLNVGMNAFGNPVVQCQQNISETLQVTNTASIDCNIGFWLINGPVLSGNNVTGSIGILTVSIVPSQDFNWNSGNDIPLDVAQIPASSARTITPSPYFQLGTSEGTIYFNGIGSPTSEGIALVGGKTYTTKALIWQ